MAKGKKTGGRDFAPGVSGNPGGSPKGKLERMIRRCTRKEIAEIGSMLLDLTQSEFEVMAKSKETSMMRTIICGIAIQAAKGNPSAFDKLLDRIVGKTKDSIELSGSVSVQHIETLSEEEIRQKIAAQDIQLKKLLAK